MNKEYKVAITETLQRIVPVTDVNTYEEAMAKVRRMYETGQAVLDSDDLLEATISHADNVVEKEVSNMTLLRKFWQQQDDATDVVFDGDPEKYYSTHTVEEYAEDVAKHLETPRVYVVFNGTATTVNLTAETSRYLEKLLGAEGNQKCCVERKPI